MTRLGVDQILEFLAHGEMELLGLMPGASNYTYAADVTRAEMRTLAVYKPREGEAPLWDFPDGTLYAREAAAFVVSEAMEVSFVPPTVVREGPQGIGSVQLFIDHDPTQHYFTLLNEHAGVFRLVAAFDIVTNNADRKSGHCLIERGTDRIWMVDHGVCFHVEDKLRTVIWDFAGEELPGDVITALRALVASFDGLAGDTLRSLLFGEEVDAIFERARALLAAGRFPDVPEDRRPYPWPPV